MHLSMLTISLKPGPKDFWYRNKDKLLCCQCLLPVKDCMLCSTWSWCPWCSQSLLVNDCNPIARAKSSVSCWSDSTEKHRASHHDKNCTCIRIWVGPRHLDFWGGCLCGEIANPSFCQLLIFKGNFSLLLPLFPCDGWGGGGGQSRYLQCLMC